MPDSVPMIRMSNVQQTAVHWLWYPYIPFGKLTILQGNPGEGKTYFAMYLAAACTNRQQLPNGELLEPFNVIYQTAEDGLGDTVKPRLIEAGADLDRVLVIDDRESMLTLTDNRIERAIRENQAKLLIIDPIQAFLGAQVDMNRANEVRPIFRALGEIAEAHDCAILMIGHLNKASGSQSTYRGLGSIDMTAAVRSLLFIGKVRDDPTTRASHWLSRSAMRTVFAGSANISSPPTSCFPAQNTRPQRLSVPKSSFSPCLKTGASVPAASSTEPHRSRAFPRVPSVPPNETSHPSCTSSATEHSGW